MYFYANYIEGRSVNWGMEIERMDESAIENKSGLMGIYNEIKDKVEGYEIDLGWIEIEVNGVGSRWYKNTGETAIRIKGIEKDIEDNTEEWLEEYSKLAGEGMMDDMEYRILTELIRKGVIRIYGEEHIVVIRDNKGYGVLDEGEGYEEGDNKISGDQEDGREDNKVSIRKKNAEFEDDMEYIYRVMLSERGMGYWNISGYEEKGVHVDIGYEYEIEFGGKKYILPAYYGVALRDAMMKDISRNRLGKRGIGGNNGVPKSIPTFQRWQYEIVRDFSHKTVVANSRRSGKGSEENEYILVKDKGLIRYKDIEVGDYVLGSDYKWKRVIRKAVEREPAVEVELINGYKFISTPEHPVPTHTNYNPINDTWDTERDDYKPARELTTEDFVVLYNGEDLIEWGNRINKKEEKEYFKNGQRRDVPSELCLLPEKYKYAFLGGLLLTDGYLGIRKGGEKSDGFYRKDRPYIEYANKSQEFIKKIAILLNYMRINYSIKERYIKSNYNKQGGKYYYIYIYDMGSIKKILEYCGKYLRHKKNYTAVKEIINNYNSNEKKSIDVIPLYFRKKYGKQEVKNRGGYKDKKVNKPPRYNFQRRKVESYYLENTLKYRWVRVKNVKNIGYRNIVHLTVEANDMLFFDTGILQHNSVLSAYFAIRELLRENYRGMMKRIIYIGLTMEKTETVWKYLQGMLRRFQTVSGVFKLKTGQGKRTIEFITDDKKKIVDGTVELISAESKAAGVGEYADLLVIDEASRMSAEVYNNVQPIIDLEGAKAYIISTVYWDTVKNWFYKMLTYAERWSMTRWKETRNKRLRNVIMILDEINTDWETGTYLFETDENGEYIYSEDERKKIARKNFEMKHEEYYEILSENWYEMEFLGRRYTIDDITRLNKREKERAKENMKKTDIMRYYCEYYSVFPGQGKVFQVEGRLVKRLSEKYDKIYIGYDPAKLSDSAGFVCIGIREDGKVEVIKSERLKSTDYKIQIEKLEELKEEMESYYKCKVVKVMDITGVGIAVEELMRHMGNKIDVAIMWKGSGEQKYERGIFKVLKRDLVGTTEVLFQRRKIFIYTDDNKDLIDEINNYESIKTPSGNIKYETTGDYDDLVSAMLVALYTYLKLDGGEKRVFTDMQNEKQIGMTYKQVHSILSKMTEQRDKDKRTKIRQTLYFQ